MEKVGWKRKSLKWDFVKYVLLCALSALLGSWMIGSVTNYIQDGYIEKYELFVSGDSFVYEKGVNPVKKNYYAAYEWIERFQVIAIPLWSLASVVIFGGVFYRKKIEKSISTLLDASEKIANNHLDFSIEVSEQNELGIVCRSFEKMRVALQENSLEMWRQVEERKRLNAAFAHDLRTPLTVLKGQSEMLERYSDKMSGEKIVSTARMMGRHIARLEEYVNTMNELQRLEDIEIHKEGTNISNLLNQMRMTGASVCETKDFMFYEDVGRRKEVKVDHSVIMQVYENLLANAVRFAAERVTVTVHTGKEMILVIVADDGVGFSARDLKEATKPFINQTVKRILAIWEWG